MRVSTMGMFLQGLRSMQELQSISARTQEQIATGKRILSPSDDPISASRALRLRDALSRFEQFDRNSNMAQTRLQEEEVALQGVNDVLQRVRELALQANNATQSNESRAMIAVEMRQHLDALVQLANQKDGSGRFLFAGNLDETSPVVVSGGSYAYNGDQGQRQIQIGETRTVVDGDSGADVFFKIRQGNGRFIVDAPPANTGSGVVGDSSVVDPSQYDGAQYTIQFIDPSNYEVRDSSNALVATGGYSPGESIGFQGIEFSINGSPAAGDEFVASASPLQDIFSSIQNLVAAVETTASGEVSRAVMNNGINRGLDNVDQAIGNILTVRTQVGARLTAIENQTDSNGGFALTLQQTIGELEDLDYAEAISSLSFELGVLEAAQQSFVRTQSLSLFNFLR